MKEFLARQVKDKAKMEAIDKEVIDEQAKLWKEDREKFEKDQAEFNRKAKELTKKNKELLEKQMHEHKNPPKGMDDIEYTINKGYLKGIRSKKNEILNEGV